LLLKKEIVMSLEEFLNVLACIALILFGVYALLRPTDAAGIAHLKLDDSNAVAETRISFGALSFFMGIAPIVLNQPAAYQGVGMVVRGVFVTRLITTFVDHPQTDRMFIISALFELIVGLILLAR